MYSARLQDMCLFFCGFPAIQSKPGTELFFARPSQSCSARRTNVSVWITCAQHALLQCMGFLSDSTLHLSWAPHTAKSDGSVSNSSKPERRLQQLARQTHTQSFSIRRMGLALFIVDKESSVCVCGSLEQPILNSQPYRRL